MHNTHGWWRLSLLLCSLCATPSTSAPLELSQVPLFINLVVEPNIVLLMDDSGSMRREFLPEDLNQHQARLANYGIEFLFPSPSDLYDPSNTPFFLETQRIPAFYPVKTDFFGIAITINSEDDNLYNKRYRSAAINTLYYNPDRSYLPWRRADGSRFPDANPEQAYHHPIRPQLGSVDLTREQRQYAEWLRHYRLGSAVTYDTSIETLHYWPAQYYRFGVSATGVNISQPDPFNPDHYQQVLIQPNVDHYPYRNAEGEMATRSYAQELQNFANWYQYHRSRTLLARAAASESFAQQGDDIRVGFATLNQSSQLIDGQSHSSLQQGVRRFSGADREQFFTHLFEHPVRSSTPLRRALDDIGDYFTRSDNQGPWSQTPGQVGPDTPQLSCRRNYSLLVSDGYWNADPANTSAANQNVDNQPGPLQQHAQQPLSYQYQPIPPFQDIYAGTLADVAMYYWLQDLRPDLSNSLIPQDDNPAFWQHMVTHTVNLGLPQSALRATLLDNIQAGRATWPNPFGNENIENRLDDLWHAAVNGRGMFFNAQRPSELTQALSQALTTIVQQNSASASISINATQSSISNRLYQTRFNSSHWHGEVRAFSAQGALQGDPPLWTSADTLDHSSADERQIFMGQRQGNQYQLQPFLWQNLSPALRSRFNRGPEEIPDQLGPQRLAYLRGDRSEEGHLFRQRSGILGDIVHSQPRYVGRPSAFYPSNLEAVSYRDFIQAQAQRPGMLYVGANDGMLHAFDAENGREVFAYIPSNQLEQLPQLSDPDYNEQHRYFVDATPSAADVFVGDAWRTLLVGSLGSGGRGLYALDITQPLPAEPSDIGTTFRSLTPAIPQGPQLRWEYNADQSPELGFIHAAPLIQRGNHNGWLVLSGQGYNSNGQGEAQLLLLDANTGQPVRRQPLSTGVGRNADPSGQQRPNTLTGLTALDINQDHNVDYVYAGDLFGNLWRFDLTAEDPEQWQVSHYNTPGPTPLLSARHWDAQGNAYAQPITSAPLVLPTPDGQFVIIVATGKYLETRDITDTQIQSIYGVIDRQVALPTLSSLQQRNSILQPQQLQALPPDHPDNPSSFEVRRVTQETLNTAHAGWVIDLPSAGERVVQDLRLFRGRLQVTTLIPSQQACDFGGSGFLLELSPLDGGFLDYPVRDLNQDGHFDMQDQLLTRIDDQAYGYAGVGSRSGIPSAPINFLPAAEIARPDFSPIALGGLGAVSDPAADEMSPDIAPEPVDPMQPGTQGQPDDSDSTDPPANNDTNPGTPTAPATAQTCSNYSNGEFECQTSNVNSLFSGRIQWQQLQ